MGSEEFYREEGPVRQVTVRPFLISSTEVTNADFAAFVAATGYVTTAERGPDPAEHPDWPKELLQPRSMVFIMPEKITGMADAMQWWHFIPGADWRHPEGPECSIEGRATHPERTTDVWGQHGEVRRARGSRRSLTTNYK